METIEDIVREMRKKRENIADAVFNAPLCYSTDSMSAQIEILDEFIDRIEAAHNREVADALDVGGIVAESRK